MRRLYPIRRMLPFLGILATVLLMIFAFVLGLVSFGKMRQVVTEEFNGQQLVLAQNLAALIQQDLDFLRRELTVLNLSPSVQYSESPSLVSRLKVTLSSIQEGELLEIRRVSADGGEAVVLDRSGVVRTEAGPAEKTGPHPHGRTVASTAGALRRPASGRHGYPALPDLP